MNQKENEAGMSSSVFYTVAKVGKYLLYLRWQGHVYMHTHLSRWSQVDRTTHVVQNTPSPPTKIFIGVNKYIE